MSAEAFDMEATVSAIRYHHRQRCFAMDQRKRMDLSLGWYLKTVLGWSKELPKAERDGIARTAGDLVKTGEKLAKMRAKPESKQAPVPGTDEPAFREHADVIMAAIAGRAPFDAVEAAAEKAMGRLAQTLPVWSWCDPIRGFGAMSLAVIVGESGDLSKYDGPAKLWKRMGLAVHNGVRQGGLSKSAPKEDWILHGYNRQRRSRMWNIGQALVKNNGDGAYRAVYLAEKERQRDLAEAAGLTVAPAGSIPKAKASEYRSLGHIDRRAQRYMEKRLLRDLWRAWRREARSTLEPTDQVPSAEDLMAAE